MRSLCCVFTAEEEGADDLQCDAGGGRAYQEPEASDGQSV